MKESIKRYIVAKRRSEQGKQIRRQYKNDIGVPYQLCKGYSLMLGGYSNTITTFASVDNWILELKNNDNMNNLTYHEHPTKEQLLEYFSQRIRVRKMHEREAMRLMDVDDADIDKIMALPFKSMHERREYFASKEDELQRLETELTSLKAEIKDGKWVLNNEGIDPETKKQVNTAIKQYRANKSNINRIKRRGIAKTAVYKLAGNSIVVSCLYHIFRTLLLPDQPENMNTNKQLTLFDI